MKVGVFLAEGFEEIEAFTVIDVLRRARIDVSTVAVSDNFDIQGAHGITVITDCIIEEFRFDLYDMLLLPGGMPGTLNLMKSTLLTDQIKKFNEKGKWLAAICAAPRVLGSLGVLEGKTATCYPGNEKELKGAELSTENVVISDNVVTSRGAGTAMMFALELVKLIRSEKIAQELKENMLIPHEI